MNSIDIVALLQQRRYLLDAVFVTIEHDDFDITVGVRIIPQIVDELLVILDAGIDEDNLPRALFCRSDGITGIVVLGFVGVKVAKNGTGQVFCSARGETFYAARKQAAWL